MQLTIVLAALAAVGAVAQNTKTRTHTRDPVGYPQSTTKSRTKTRTHTKGPAHTKTRTHTKGHTKTKGGKTKTKTKTGNHTKGDHHTKTKGGNHTKSDEGGAAGGVKTHTRSHHGDSTSYTTVTYDTCPESSIESLLTVTEGKTITYCEECAHAGYTTTYTTVYESLCPTGVVPQTYTVTESCTEATPTWTPGTSHIPQGFTVTTKTCEMGCGETPVPVTITEPCGCEAHEGTPAPTEPGRTPATATEPASPPPYPTASCPGPQCGAQSTGGMMPPPYNNTPGIVPATGLGVSNLGSPASVYSFIIAAVIAALAFAL